MLRSARAKIIERERHSSTPLVTTPTLRLKRSSGGGPSSGSASAVVATGSPGGMGQPWATSVPLGRSGRPRGGGGPYDRTTIPATLHSLNRAIGADRHEPRDPRRPRSPDRGR